MPELEFEMARVDFLSTVEKKWEHSITSCQTAVIIFLNTFMFSCMYIQTCMCISVQREQDSYSQYICEQDVLSIVEIWEESLEKRSCDPQDTV